MWPKYTSVDRLIEIKIHVDVMFSCFLVTFFTTFKTVLISLIILNYAINP